MMRLERSEAQKRFDRLDTLRVLTEGYEEGVGFGIYEKAYRASRKPVREFTGIIRLTTTEKDFLGYILDENPYLNEEDKAVLRFYIG